MDEPTMKKLYEFNMAFDKDKEYTSTTRKRKHEHPECWAGFGLRLMLMLLYTISMLCLLRYDEALRITWADVHLEYLAKGRLPFCVRLDLPFRKTHQHGGRPASLLVLSSADSCMHRYCTILPLCRPEQTLDVPSPAHCTMVGLV